jgi:lysophospholipase L1-like esterase
MVRCSMLLRILIAVCVASAYTAPQPAPQGYPSHMAALGDSLTRAANADTHGDRPDNSWSTGGRIPSHATLIRRRQPMLQATNAAVSGASMQALADQAATLPPTVDYVTILMGGNDVCQPSEAHMTSVAVYREQFAAGMAVLSQRLPDARIFVSGNPNVLGLWEALHAHPQAREAWARNGSCQAMLANPGSTDPRDVARRQRVQQRLLDYNAQLAAVCAEFIHCRYEGGSLTHTPVEPSSVSALDFFHLSIAGQTELAALTFLRTFDFTDTAPPQTTLSSAAGASSYTLTMTATDNVGVAGIEYRLNGGPWTRYAAPLAVPLVATVAYRAVDVNGVNEPIRIVTVPQLILRTCFMPFLHAAGE